MKKENELLNTIKNTFTNIFLEKGIYFVDAEYVKEPKGYVLRIFIDKDGGVDLDSCEIASNLVSDWLDEMDPIEDSYFLEVSSPGAEREIKNDEELKKFVNRNILVKCYKKVNGDKEFIGNLKTFDKEKLTLTIGKSSIDFLRKDIAIIKSQIEI